MRILRFLKSGLHCHANQCPLSARWPFFVKPNSNVFDYLSQKRNTHPSVKRILMDIEARLGKSDTSSSFLICFVLTLWTKGRLRDNWQYSNAKLTTEYVSISNFSTDSQEINKTETIRIFNLINRFIGSIQWGRSLVNSIKNSLLAQLPILVGHFCWYQELPTEL